MVAAARLAGIEERWGSLKRSPTSRCSARLEHIRTWQEIDFIKRQRASPITWCCLGWVSFCHWSSYSCWRWSQSWDDSSCHNTSFSSCITSIGTQQLPLLHDCETKRAIPVAKLWNTSYIKKFRRPPAAKHHQVRVVLLSPACAKVLTNTKNFLGVTIIFNSVRVDVMNITFALFLFEVGNNKFYLLINAIAGWTKQRTQVYYLI